MWSMVGALGGAGISAWSANYNRKKSESFNAAMASASAKRNYEYWEKSWYKNLLDGPSLQRQGLERAGYNPMLALGSMGVHPFSGGSAAASSSPVSPDIVGSARHGAELANDIAKAFDNKNKKDEAEIDAIKSGIARENKESEARIQNLEADTILKGSQKSNTDADTWLDNPIISPLAGLLGGVAAEKLGGLFGGSAKSANSVGNVVKKVAPAAKGVPAAIGLGSKMLGGISLPLLFSAAAIGAYGIGSKAYPEYSKEVKKNMRKEISRSGLPVVY